MANTKEWKHAPDEELNGASEVLFTCQGKKPDESHLKQAIESWLSDKKSFHWDQEPLRGNNWSQVMWKSSENCK